MISAKLCVKCKGKLLCGLSYCPILQRYSARKKIVSGIRGNGFTGSSPPSLFVSWRDYPKVAIAPLSPAAIMDSGMLDLPEQWFGLPAEQIVSFRERLIRSNKKLDVHAASNPDRQLADMQELAMAEKPTAIDVRLHKKPVPRLSFHESVAPLGPSAPMINMSLQENPKVARKVDYAVSDTDMKANDALMQLYGAGFAVSKLHKLLSAGVLGVGKRRKLTPTRWSIAATDSCISKNLVEEKLKGFQQLGEFQLFHSNYLDNLFWVLLIPSAWAFEQLECWLPGGAWALNAKQPSIIQDHEFYAGRKDYAANVEGAYYSARLAVAEHLLGERRQAAAVVFREIGQGYNIPLGVWVIRQAVREAFNSKPMVFSNLKLVLAFLERKLKVPVKNYAKESRLLDMLMHQKKLSDFSA